MYKRQEFYEADDELIQDIGTAYQEVIAQFYEMCIRDSGKVTKLL